MATGKSLVCKLGKHIPIEGADNIIQINMFGETIITQKSNQEGDLGLLFDMETCLSHEYASKNNMYRKSELNEDKSITGYLDDDRRIRAIKLKGVKVSGLWMPINTLKNITDKIDELSVGTEIDSINGVPICEKYVSKATKKGMTQNKEGRVNQNLCPTFKEHIDSDQWARNSHKINVGNIVYITEKLHGTSGRCGFLPVKEIIFNKWSMFWFNLATFMTKGIWGLEEIDAYNYKFISGSRRVVKSIEGNESENKIHFYEEDLWTKVSKEHFEGKLRKGETVYFEIVGYTPSGELIMPEVSNAKLGNFLATDEYKDFLDKYGTTTTFTYGCSNDINQHILEIERQNFYKVFVYRITMTNEDGDSIDYSWEQVKNRCEQINVNYTPELEKLLITDKGSEEYLKQLVETHTNNQSFEFPSHVREGVCIRIENGGMTPIILKNKSFIFKVLEGIVKDNNSLDIEESN
jgi:hypothetical protein